MNSPKEDKGTLSIVRILAILLAMALIVLAVPAGNDPALSHKNDFLAIFVAVPLFGLLLIFIIAAKKVGHIVGAFLVALAIQAYGLHWVEIDPFFQLASQQGELPLRAWAVLYLAAVVVLFWSAVFLGTRAVLRRRQKQY